MAYMLKVAPADWQRLSVDSATVTALSRRGLVTVRTDPKDKPGTMAGWQWKITDAGREALVLCKTIQVR